MKVSSLLIVLFTSFMITLEVQAQNKPALYHHDRFLIRNDTILIISINETILEDLNKKSINLLLNNTIFLGISFELNAIFEGNKKYGLHYYRRPYKVVHKKDQLKKTIQVTYGIKKKFLHWEYHFIGLTPETESGIYAIYELSDKSGNIQVINSTIEILENKQAIIDKIYARW